MSIGWFQALLASGRSCISFTPPSASGTLKWVDFFDNHSAQNFANGGQLDVLKFAYNQLPADVKADSLFLLLGGDYAFNPPFDTTTVAAAVAAEIAVMGVDRTYGLEGNHDWHNNLFDLYIDPLGANTATSGKNPANFPITPYGTRRRYYLRGSEAGDGNGNLMIIMVGDNEDFSSPQGENAADFGSKLYNASGGYSEETWRWVIYTILSNQDCNQLYYTHHPLKNTTAASGFLEGITAGVAWNDPTINQRVDFEAYRSSYMAFIENQLAERTFHDFFTVMAGSICAFIHGHIHLGIDEVISGRTWYETAYGMPHINACPVNNKQFNVAFRSFVTPNTKVMTVNGSAVNMKTHVHIAAGARVTGYQADLEKNITLRYPFNEDYVSSDPTTPPTQTIDYIDVTVKGCATINIDGCGCDGFLVVRRTGAYTTFSPTADTAYLRGDTAGNGTVVYMGTIDNFQDYGLFSGDEYYSVWGFNGRNNKIAFSASPAQAVATIVMADSAKILSDMTYDGGSPVLYLDSRVGVTDNSGVETWADQSGNGLNATQTTLARRPAYANSRITFTVAGQKYLSVDYNALHHFGYTTDPTWLIDVPFGMFAKVRMADATTFRICTKISGTNFEYQLVSNTSDKLNILLYDSTSGNVASYVSNIALTAYQNQDLFIFCNYHGELRFIWGSMKLYVYDKDFNLIAFDNLDTTGSAGTYSKMRNNSLPLEIGRHNFTTPDYSDGQINGLVMKRGNIFEQHEMNYLMDNFSYSDDL